MSEDVLDNFPPSFPTRFRGYDRDAVDHELHELRDALDYAQAERDRAVARAFALETGTVGAPTTTSASATGRWLIETAEQDAERIRAAAEETAREITDRAEDLLRRRMELVEQAQHEADVCRAQASEEARQIVHEALERAKTLLDNLEESELSLQELFGSGSLSHRMPPPRRSSEQVRGQHAAVPKQVTQPALQSVPQVPQPTPRPAPQPVNAVMDGQQDTHQRPISAPVQQQVLMAPPTQAESRQN